MKFQSTHPHGVRRVARNVVFDLRNVSIHAPTRGATSLSTRETSGSVCFNPRTHTGCDRESSGIERSSTSFNPRTHTGCDIIEAAKVATPWVSIHAPTRGATKVSKTKTTLSMFQSTHPHGVRPLIYNNIFPVSVFQSTHPHGVRPMRVRDIDFIISVSIHAPTRGATREHLDQVRHTFGFQSTHPHGVRLC